MTISLLAFLASFALAAASLPGLIRLLTRRKAQQVISEDVPETHQLKRGTPTLGGIAIVLSAAAVSLFYAAVTPGADNIMPLVLLLLATSFLGFWDDYLILSRGRSAGQKWSQKMMGQLALAAAFVTYLWFYRPPLTQIILPGMEHSLSLGLAWCPLAVLYLVLMSNAVNLSDGLDGLAGGLCLIAAGACAAVGLYERMPDLAVFALALGGACLGFLWYNCHPAQIFMGNTSSIALGMGLGGVAVMARQEILLLIPFAVFLAEAVSVILQVGYFKLSGGKRIFKKAPLHHHFEMLGWKETRVVTRFWITGLLLALVGILWLNGGFPQ